MKPLQLILIGILFLFCTAEIFGQTEGTSTSIKSYKSKLSPENLILHEERLKKLANGTYTKQKHSSKKCINSKTTTASLSPESTRETKQEVIASKRAVILKSIENLSNQAQNSKTVERIKMLNQLLSDIDNPNK